MIACVSTPPPSSSSSALELVVMRPSFFRRSSSAIPLSKSPTSAFRRASPMIFWALAVPISAASATSPGRGDGQLHQIGVPGLAELVRRGGADPGQVLEGDLVLGLRRGLARRGPGGGLGRHETRDRS